MNETPTPEIQAFEPPKFRDYQPAQIRAFEPRSFNESERTVEVVFATETPVLRYVWDDGEVDEVLSLSPASVNLARFNSGAAVLDNHNRYGSVTQNVIGTVVSARIEGGKGIAIVRFADTEKAREVMGMVADGILRNVSVGYSVEQWEIRKGENYKRPEYRASNWTPLELSFVGIPADAGAQVRSASVAAASESPAAAVAAAEPPAARAQEKKSTGVEPQKPSQMKDTPEILRMLEIADTAGIDLATARQWAAEEGMTVEGFSAKAIAEMAKRQTPPAQNAPPEASVRGDEKEARIEAMKYGLMLRAGQESLIPSDEKKKAHETGRKFRNMTAADLMRVAIETDGGTPSHSLDENFRMAMHSGTYRRDGYQATGTFPVLLEDVMHQVLVGAYEEQDWTWGRFCGTDTARDYRLHRKKQDGNFTTLQLVPESGEIKTVQIPDGAAETFRVDDYGGMIGITRKVTIDDSLDAILRTVAKFGRSAARTIEATVYARLAENGGLGPLLSDGNPLFHNRAGVVNNIGTSTVLGTAGLINDVDAMKYFRDLAGNPIATEGGLVLLVPHSLATRARTLNTASYDTTVNSAFQAPNEAQGLFSDIIGTAYLAQGSTRRYIFNVGAPDRALNVAFLNGDTAPRMETMQGFEIEGMKVRIAHTFGVFAYEPRYAMTNAGT